MTQQVEALRLANLLEQSAGASSVYRDKSAALLRFLHKENAELRSANAYASDVIQPMETRINTLEAALRQAVEALEHMRLWADGPEPLPSCVVDCDNAIAALRKALGDKHD